MKIRFDTATVSWLCDPSEVPLEMHSEDKDIIRTPVPLPPEIGSGWLSKVNLPMGMAVFNTDYIFTPKAAGQVLSLADVHIPLHGEALMVQVMRQGRSMQRDHILGRDFIFSPGYTLFRYGDQFHIRPSVDCTSDVSMIGCVIIRPALNLLLGEFRAEQMLTRLEVMPAPKVAIHSVPETVSTYVYQTAQQSLAGNVRKLFIQARALDYLAALCEHLGVNEVESTALSTSRSRAEQVYNHLINTNGKIPTLDELAAQFRISAQTLNNDFKSIYGQTIVAFILDHRLMEAHEAIKHSNVALKTIGQRLGYVHTNHFLTAFKRKFGYSPGSLRKNKI